MDTELALAEQARALVNASPELARDRAAELLTRLSEPEARAVAERAYGLAVKELGDTRAAAQHLRRAVRIADRAGLAVRAAEARSSLVVVLAERGDPDAALREADLASPVLRGGAAGRLLIQRALVLQRMGRFDDALRGYREAFPLLRRAGDAEYDCLGLLRRGTLHAYRGDHAGAWADLSAAVDLAERHGLRLLHSFAVHNLGFAAFMKGDLPAALALLDASLDAGGELGRPIHPVKLMDRAAVLVAAGLAEEAVDTLQRACEQLAKDGLASDLAEARLWLASAALLHGDTALATSSAAAAVRDFTRQRRTAWTVLARYVEASARWASGERSAALLALARRVAVQLESAGWPVASVEAHVLAGQLALALGRNQLAEIHLSVAARRRRRGPAQRRAAGWHGEALLRLHRGDRGGALVALRSGLTILADNAATLGATDLRAHVGVHAEEMGALGLGLAVRARTARSVLAWAERRRAGALRHGPVRPPEDSQLAGDLAELRRITAEIDEAGLAGRSTRALHTRRVRLESAIRDRSRHVRGSYAPTPAFEHAALGTALGARALIELVRDGDRLYAVTVVDGRTKLTELGSFDLARRETESLRFSLNRIARRHGGPELVELARRTARHAAAVLDDLVLRPLAAETGDRDLVLVPTGALHALPWPVLPSCAGRPLVVAPSATSWISTATGSDTVADTVEDGAGAASGSVGPGAAPGAAPDRAPGGAGGQVVLAAGPGLEHAEPEIAALAGRYPGAVVLSGTEATAAAVAAGMDGAALAHIAAHGIFRADNAQFSHLRLADGPLTVYDLEQLGRAPRTLVLSACDSALSAVRPGDELMGVAAAVFALGTRTLVASVTPVHDADTRTVMLALHDRLLAGSAPAQALADAAASTGIDGFVCLGAG